jgi:beta-galactosidase
MNGVIFANRTVNAKYWEVKSVYSPVQFHQVGNDIRVINRSSHLSLQAYRCDYQVMENGKITQKGSLTLPNVQPGDSAVLTQTQHFKCSASKDCRLNLKVYNAQGEEVVTQQMTLNENLLSAGKSLLVAMEKTKTSISEKLKDISFTCYRAPTDNDNGFGHWLAKDWKENRLDSPLVVRISDTQQEYRYTKGSILVTTERQINKDGSVDLTQRYQFKGNLPELSRLSMVIKLPKEYEQLSWYGRGPWDSYPDRKEAALFGLWQSTVTEQYTHYPHPQDNGNHEDCSVLLLNSSAGHTLRIEAIDAPFSFSALHETAQDIVSAKTDQQLREGNYTILTLNAAVLGLGNSSCGPGVLKKYAIDKNKSYVLKVRIR